MSDVKRFRPTRMRESRQLSSAYARFKTARISAVEQVRQAPTPEL